MIQRGGATLHENSILQTEFLNAGMDNPIRTLCFSPDNKLIAVGCDDKSIQIFDFATRTLIATLIGHKDQIATVAFAKDSKVIASASFDHTIRLWDVNTKECISVLEGHRSSVTSLAFSSDDSFIVSGSKDKTVRIWDTVKNECTAILKAHTGYVNAVAVSNDSRLIISGSDDKTVKLWDIAAQSCLTTLRGHAHSVLTVAISSDNKFAYTGGKDTGILVWDIIAKKYVTTLKGHDDYVQSLVISPDCQLVISGSDDRTVKVWDANTKKCLATIEGHTSFVKSVAMSFSQRFIISGALNNKIGVWDTAALGFTDGDVDEDALPYMNARVLLVGETGVGKTGLAQRLIDGSFSSSFGTDGAWATIVPLPDKSSHGKVKAHREIWLWDFAAQNDYRILHQLFMDKTSLAITVFDSQNPNPFDGVIRWNNDIRNAAGGNFAKLLVAGRTDLNKVVVGSQQISSFVEEHGFDEYIETSAKTGTGCENLLEAIRKCIDWSQIELTISPKLFRRLKEEIIKLRDQNHVLLRREELRQRLEIAMGEEVFTNEEFETVVKLLASPGIVWELDFGGFILLRPEIISQYAGALVRSVRSHPDETGCITEKDFAEGHLDYQERARLSVYDEEIILRALLQTLIKRGICFQQPTDKGNVLIFPSLFKIESSETTKYPIPFVTYYFEGLLEDIYARLVVRLLNTRGIERKNLWRDAAEFTTKAGRAFNIKISRKDAGTCELSIHCDSKIAPKDRVAFTLFIDEHIQSHASSVARIRHYVCSRCETEIGAAAVAKGLDNKKYSLFCSYCGQKIILNDDIEQYFLDDSILDRVEKMRGETEAVLDAQSKEQILLGEMTAIAGKAGQIFRPTPNPDYGVDGEIEFKTANGIATAKRIYLQLKSGDSYLRVRSTDKAEIFTIPKDRHIDYWQEHPGDVYLVIRDGDGHIRWMNITDYLKHQTKRSKQVVFEGTDFTAHELVLLRDRVIGTDN